MLRLISYCLHDFSYQGLRKDIIRLHALSFYLQEKKVRYIVSVMYIKITGETKKTEDITESVKCKT